MTVADIGAGRGAMALVFAHWLGPAGHVYATDIGEAQLEAIRDDAAKEQLPV
jgi:precorrin-6B methylase 2